MRSSSSPVFTVVVVGAALTLAAAALMHVIGPRIIALAVPAVVNGLGVWWRKLGLDGKNVNELTSQRLTDLGRAPTFYDCLVEVAAG